MLSCMLGRYKYCISLSRDELRMLRESPVKNYALIIPKMAGICSNEDETHEYITLTCQGHSKNFVIVNDNVEY
jgi:hypothetical protein